MNTAMQHALIAIGHACNLGNANRQSVYALDIIADAMAGDVDLHKQWRVILAVAERLVLDGVPADGDGDLLLAAARTIALVTEQRSEDRYVWGEQA